MNRSYNQTRPAKPAPTRAWVRPAVTRLKAGQAESGLDPNVNDGGFASS